MSSFTDTMFASAQWSVKGMTTGEPDAPVRHTWGEVHERARRIAGGLAAAGVGPGDAVAVLAGAPVEIAPTAQGIWMRGASLTMLHQPTPRTDLQRWAEETTAVIDMIDARAVVVSDPFMPAAPLLEQLGMRVSIVAELLQSDPVDPVTTFDDDVALMQLTSGSTGSPKAVRITHANIVANAEAMFVGANFDPDTDVIVSWLPCFHDMGMTGYLTVPMYFGAELVKVTPMDFLRDTLLWAKLIDKYKATMTAAPELRLQPVRQAAAPPGHPRPVRPVLAAVGAVGRRAGRPGRRRGPLRGRRAVRPAARGDHPRLRHGRDDGGGVVLRVRRRHGRRRGRRRPAGRPAPRGPGHQGHTPGGWSPSAGRCRAWTLRVVDEDGAVLTARGVGVIEVRGEPVTRGYTTVARIHRRAGRAGLVRHR